MTGLKYVLKLRDGTVYEGMLGTDIRKTVDKRSDRAPHQIVYEVRKPSGVVIRVWEDEVAQVGGELV